MISITDHDTIKSYKELVKINDKEIYQGQIITGVEFNTVYNGVLFHLIVYDFNYKELDNWIHENYETRKINLNAEFEFMLES